MVKEKEKCLICNDNRDFVNLGAHLIQKHQMTRDQYEREYVSSEDPIISEEVLEEDDFEEIEDESSVIAPDQLRDNRLSVKTHDLSVSLESYLEEKGMTLKELNNLVRRFKNGDAINVTQALERNKKKGEEGANSLQDQEIVETQDVNVAESLIKKHGFVHVDTRSGPPKVHVLKKK